MIILSFNYSSAAPEDVSDIIQTGIISTSKGDFSLSSDLVIKQIIENKLFKIWGTTIDGNFYYAYHRIVNENVLVLGKVLVNGQFVPIIPKPEIVTNEITREIEKDLFLDIKQPHTSIPPDLYKIQVKVFDKKINPTPEILKNFGTVPEIDVSVTITHQNGNPFKILNGKTDSNGFFLGSFQVLDNDRSGKYIVLVTASDGTNSISEEKFTFIEEAFISDGKAS